MTICGKVPQSPQPQHLLLRRLFVLFVLTWNKDGDLTFNCALPADFRFYFANAYQLSHSSSNLYPKVWNVRHNLDQFALCLLHFQSFHFTLARTVLITSVESGAPTRDGSGHASSAEHGYDLVLPLCCLGCQMGLQWLAGPKMVSCKPSHTYGCRMKCLERTES